MQFCPKKQMKGITIPGYFCEYTLVDAATAVVIPEDIAASAAELSPVFCAGITVWDAVTRAKLAPGETVAVIGVGGLGEMATKYAAALGARVIALDIHDEQLRSVEGGASVDAVLNTAEMQVQDVAGEVRKLNAGRGVDVVIVTSGSVQAYQTGLTLLRPEGRLIAVGIPMQEVSLRIGQVAMQPIRSVDFLFFYMCWVFDAHKSLLTLMLIVLLGLRCLGRLVLRVAWSFVKGRVYFLRLIRGSFSWRISMR